MLRGCICFVKRHSTAIYEVLFIVFIPPKILRAATQSLKIKLGNHLAGGREENQVFFKETGFLAGRLLRTGF